MPINFCTTIILVKNKIDFIENLSIIFQFSSQNHGDLQKKKQLKKSIIDQY